MKAVRYLFLLLSLLTIVPTMIFAQAAHSQIIAVINVASWCGVCKANSPRVKAEALPKYEASKVLFVVNDLSNDITRKRSQAKLAQQGIVQTLEATTDAQNTAGIIILVDALNKQLLGRAPIANSGAQIKKWLDETLAATRSASTKAYHHVP